MQQNTINRSISLYLHKAWRSVSSIMLIASDFNFWLWGASKVARSSPLVELCFSAGPEQFPCTYMTTAEYFKVTGNVQGKWVLLNLHRWALLFPCDLLQPWPAPSLSLRWVFGVSGALSPFTQCERSLVAYGWAEAGACPALQLLSYVLISLKRAFVFQPVSPYSQKWALCFHLLPLRQFSVLRFFVAAWALIQAST